jgi:pSer/pThr/pTyr-binding forkhead associated (FHA) protein
MANFNEHIIVRRESNWIKQVLRSMRGWIRRFHRRGELQHRVTLVKAPAWHQPYLPTIPAAEFRQLSQQDSVTATLPLRQTLHQQWALRAIAGPHAGQQFALTQLPALLGRVEEAAVRLVQDKHVSRRHAEFYEQQETLRLRDLLSKQGTTVNGHFIQDQGIVAGDEIQIGQSLLVVEQRKVSR